MHNEGFGGNPVSHATFATGQTQPFCGVQYARVACRPPRPIGTDFGARLPLREQTHWVHCIKKKQPRRGGCFSWKVEATTGFEPVNGGFANLWLTTCLRRQRDTGMQCNRVGQALKCVIAWLRTERPPRRMDASHDFDFGLKASSRAASAFSRSPPQ